MNQPQDRAGIDVLPSWTLTTTAIWCADANQRAILIVKGDWSAYCVLLREHEARRMDLAGCRGEACRYLQEYRARLIAETLSSETNFSADSDDAGN
ncbi:MAG: hypothetical protein M5U30_17370 [Burkholderiaceae bacterium]|nr:hypothetical protein [Burkholderiaceae bacterium]